MSNFREERRAGYSNMMCGHHEHVVRTKPKS